PVGADGEGPHERRGGRRGSAARAAGHVLGVPRVPGRAEEIVVGGHTLPELVGRGLAGDDRARGAEPLRHATVPLRHVVAEHARTVGRAQPRRVDQVLHADRDAVQQAAVRAGGAHVHLQSVLESGEPALIIDERLAPYFFVRAADEAALRRLAPGARLVPSELRALGGEPVVRVEVALPGDVPGVRNRLGEAGVDCLEADLRFAYRYLIDHGIRGAFAVAGDFERRPGVGRVYRNPTLAPAELAPRLRVLSLDVETSLDGQRLYSLALA